MFLILTADTLFFFLGGGVRGWVPRSQTLILFKCHLFLRKHRDDGYSYIEFLHKFSPHLLFCFCYNMWSTVLFVSNVSLQTYYNVSLLFSFERSL